MLLHTNTASIQIHTQGFRNNNFIAVVQSVIDNTSCKQEIATKLNSETIGINGDNANLMSTFMGQYKKNDILNVLSYKTGGNFSTFFTRVILIPG